MVNLFFFSEINIRGNHAGTKARNDAEHILEEFGAIPINSRRYELRSDENDRIISNIHNRLDYLSYYYDLLKIRNKSIVIQYPMLSFDAAEDYVRRLSKKNRVFFLVHDVHSLRNGNVEGVKKEIALLNMAYGVIVHNHFMKEKLIESGLKTKSVFLLSCFDYLHEGTLLDRRGEEGIAFAGNLEKSEFLQELCIQNPDVSFHLYGPGGERTAEYASNACYYGSYPPDVIPEKLKGRFGLVWDGDTIKTCKGLLGEYTRINNPHKLSLYIAAGIPVVVWKEAAISEFVEQKGIGISVSNLMNLNEQLRAVGEEEYRRMRSNVLREREAVIHGDYLTEVLERIREIT